MIGIRRCSGVLNNTPPSDDVVRICAQVTAQTHNGGWLYSCGVSLGNIALTRIWSLTVLFAHHQENGKTLAHVGFMERVLEALR